MAQQILECIFENSWASTCIRTHLIVLPLLLYCHCHSTCHKYDHWYAPAIQTSNLTSKRHHSLTHSKGHDASMNQSYVFLKQGYSNSQLDEVYTRVCFITMCSSSDLTETWTEVEEARCELRWEEGCVKCGLWGVKNDVCSLSGEAKGVKREVWAMRCEVWDVKCVCKV